ncbi:MAG: hypothetical protein DRJ64_06675 [Thermoprotei archaeon]|nr:MAG: hypothetical protein DRJ64_06675 [Thermoprotei archaeon]
MKAQKFDFLFRSIMSFVFSALSIGLVLLIQIDFIPNTATWISTEWIKFIGIVFFSFLSGGYFAVGLVYWFGYRKIKKIK